MRIRSDRHDWTEEEIDKIADLLRTKQYNARQISEIIGQSRNSIMGLLWRTPKLKEIGLPNQKQVNKPITSKPESKPKSKPKTKKELPPMSEPESRPELEPKPVVEVIKSGPYNLLELKDNHCKFPLWEHTARPKMEQMLFCCKPILVGTPYCEEHCKLCFSPTTARPVKPKQMA